MTLLTTGVFQIGAPGVLGNDRDPNGRTLHARLDSNPKHGRILVRGDGTVFYLPYGGFAGVDEFFYRVDNGQSSARAKVTLTLNVFTVADDKATPLLSKVRLSSAGASSTSIELRFTGALDEDALQNDPDFSVLLGGGSVKSSAVAYRDNIVTLSGFDFEVGQEIELKIGDLRAATGKTIHGGTIKLVAR